MVHTVSSSAGIAAGSLAATILDHITVFTSTTLEEQCIARQVGLMEPDGPKSTLQVRANGSRRTLIEPYYGLFLVANYGNNRVNGTRRIHQGSVISGEG